MTVSFEKAKASVKTGKSCAIRCGQCGEVTIADHFINQVMSNVKYQGIEVSSSLSEKGDALICRLCGAVNQIPPQANPMTWEEFDCAMASEELVEQTNPGVNSEIAPPLPKQPKNMARPTFALLECLWKNRKPDELLPVPVMVAVGGLVAAALGGNAVRSATASVALGWVTGILIVIVATVATVVVNYRQSLDYMADKHGTRVCRFLNEMDMELKELADASMGLGSRYSKVRDILLRIPEFYDV